MDFLDISLNFVVIAFLFASLCAVVFVLMRLYEKSHLISLIAEANEMFMVIPPHKLLAIHMVIILSFFLLGLLVVGKGLFWAVALASVGFFLPKLHFMRIKSKRAEKFDEQLVDALITIANSMKAGLTLPQSFKVVADHMNPPISQEFDLLLNEHALGATMEQCMDRALERVASKYLYIAFTATSIGQASGGNMPDILNKISETIRELSKLEKKIAAMTSQGKLQAIVLTLLPAAFGLVIYKMDPSLIAPLFNDFFGYLVIIAVVLLDAVGGFFCWKIINVEI
jgi:tight adherence protein B